MTENEPYEELEEIKKLKELSKKYKGCRCSRYCSVWNNEDRDCEIMGEYHLSPSRCKWFLMQELRREESEKPYQLERCKRFGYCESGRLDGCRGCNVWNYLYDIDALKDWCQEHDKDFMLMTMKMQKQLRRKQKNDY